MVAIYDQLSNRGLDAVQQWNRRCPGGTCVTADIHGARVTTRTRGLAFAVNGRVMVHLQGVPGAVPIESLAIGGHCCWVKLNRRGLVGHWVHGTWESEDAMLADIVAQMNRDSRIESFETSSSKPA